MSWETKCSRSSGSQKSVLLSCSSSHCLACVIMFFSHLACFALFMLSSLADVEEVLLYIYIYIEPQVQGNLSDFTGVSWKTSASGRQKASRISRKKACPTAATAAFGPLPFFAALLLSHAQIPQPRTRLSMRSYMSPLEGVLEERERPQAWLSAAACARVRPVPVIIPQYRQAKKGPLPVESRIRFSFERGLLHLVLTKHERSQANDGTGFQHK